MSSATLDPVAVAQERSSELKAEYIAMEQAWEEAKRDWEQRLAVARKAWHRARDEVAVISARLGELGHSG